MVAESTKEIRKEIWAGLKDVAERLSGHSQEDKVWTTAVKSALAEIGKKRNYYVCAVGVNERNRKHGEWLYDVCWLDWAGGQKRQLNRVILVAESEWGNARDIDDDFEKILLARADIRVMIFQAKNNDDFNKTVKRLTRFIEGFEGSEPGDTYLLFGFVDEKKAAFKLAQLSSQGVNVMEERFSAPVSQSANIPATMTGPDRTLLCVSEY